MLLPEDYHRNIFQPEVKGSYCHLPYETKTFIPTVRLLGQGEFLKDEKENVFLSSSISFFNPFIPKIESFILLTSTIAFVE